MIHISTAVSDVENSVTPTNNGEPWTYAIVLEDESVYSDSITELVGYLVAQYADSDEMTAQTYVDYSDDDALAARLNVMARMSDHFREWEASIMALEGRFDPDTVGEDALTAAMTPYFELISADQSWTLESLLGGGDAPAWNHAPSLWLLTSDFAPFNDRVAPTGNITWLDPTNERAFLVSLDAASQLKFMVHQDA